MMTFRLGTIQAWLGVFLILICPLAGAETIRIEASKDNTLYESPTGRLSNGVGEHMFTGLTNELLKRRAVIAFEELDEIPENALITSVRILLHLSKENSRATSIDLHRLAADWGEGTSDATGNEGQGANTTTDDATWIHRFSSFRTWQNAGGDYDPEESAQFLADGVGFYVIRSTDKLVADVQSWLDDPSQNFGWILVGEEDERSSKRFDSRENSEPTFRPLLEVTYSVTGTGSDFSGPWFDPTLDGEGYLIFQTPAGWIVYFFGYTSGGDRLWLTSQPVTLESLEFGETFELPMLVGTPGTFENPTPSWELEPYGTLTLRFDTCTTGQFVLDGTDGVKTANAVKIVGVDGTGCEDP